MVIGKTVCVCTSILTNSCSLVSSAGDPLLQSYGNSLTIRNREFVEGINYKGVTIKDGQPQRAQGYVFPINAQFPRYEWASGISRLFSFYRFKSLRYEFVARTNNITPQSYGGSLQCPTVSCFVDYDTANYDKYAWNPVDLAVQTYPTRNQMLDASGSKEIPLGKSFSITVDCGSSTTSNSNLLYTVSRAAEAGDYKLRDSSYGILAFRIDAGDQLLAGTNCLVYDLWIDYTLELWKPRSANLFLQNAAEKFALRFGTQGAATMQDIHKFGNSTETISVLHNTGDITSLGRHSNCSLNAIAGLSSGGASRNRVAFTPQSDTTYMINYHVVADAANPFDPTGEFTLQVGPGFSVVNHFMSGSSHEVQTASLTVYTFTAVIEAVADRMNNNFTLSGAVHTMTDGDYWFEIDTVVDLWTGTTVTTSGDLTILDMGPSDSYAA